MSDPSITIPSIDISPFLHSPTSQEAEIAISAVRNACLETGFFQITGHGISRELQDQVFAGAKEFFKLPVEEKMKVSREVSIQNGGPGNRGWERIGSQKSGEDGVADCKEVC
jgi:isopenicillin N synthase-like dioxygenase